MTHKQTKRQLKTLYLIDQFKRTHNVEEVDLRLAADWLIETGRWRPIPVDPTYILRREMTRALRGEYFEDPQDREVRKNHPVLDRETGRVVWVEITKAKPEQMRLSFSHHRNRILSECKQLALDFDSYNENNPFGVELPAVDFNFEPDIEEARMPVQYT